MLNISKSVLEMATFITLQQFIQTYLAASQSQLQELIITAAKLELKALKHQLVETIFSLTADLSKSFVIVAYPGLKDSNDFTSTVYFLATQALCAYGPMKILTK